MCRKYSYIIICANKLTVLKPNHNDNTYTHLFIATLVVGKGKVVIILYIIYKSKRRARLMRLATQL